MVFKAVCVNLLGGFLVLVFDEKSLVRCFHSFIGSFTLMGFLIWEQTLSDSHMFYSLVSLLGDMIVIVSSSFNATKNSLRRFKNLKINRICSLLIGTTILKPDDQ